ncbi:MAG: hypothetical protein IT452_24280 [Planctomycetia bacterium]|nr:hypothetical protein [Planctomycetia bacterium]
MTCRDLTNDQLLAPTAEASSHLAGCLPCRERQQAVLLASRALRALAGERPVPDANDFVVRAAIPDFAADAARRRPAGWWQVAAAAAVLLAGVAGALKYASGPAPIAPTAGIAAIEPAPAAHDPAPAGWAPKPDVTPPSKPDVTPRPPDPTPEPEPPPRPPDGRGYLAGGDLPPLPQPPAPDPPTPLPPPADTLADITVADCMDIMRTVLGEGEPVSRDLNGDGVTDVVDAYIAARRVAGMEDLK